MITNNPMQLKAYIKKMAAEKNISAQLVIQNYMMERLLERVSLSKYKENLILKALLLASGTALKCKISGQTIRKNSITPKILVLKILVIWY
jgi:hypothetical protein